MTKTLTLTFTVRRSRLALATAVLTLAAVLTACSGKTSEPFKDAGVSHRNDSPATIGTMPDGFNNWAAKCDGPNMVYTVFHLDSAYGSIAVVPNDPRCK